MIAMLLALVMAMSLMACGKQNDSNANDNNDANTGDDQPAAKTTLVVGVSADYAPLSSCIPTRTATWSTAASTSPWPSTWPTGWV